MSSAALINTAAQRFLDGDDPSFLACFCDDVEAYWEPAVSTRPVVSSRAGLADWLGHIRAENPRPQATMTEPAEHGNGAVCEVIVTRGDEPSEVWRVALAICVVDGLIREVRAFWAREAAIEWVAKFW